MRIKARSAPIITLGLIVLLTPLTGGRLADAQSPGDVRRIGYLASGQEATYCCLNAVLRDYARLGLLFAHDGRVGDRQIIPKEWLHAATTIAPDDPHLKGVWQRTNFGYGYQTWILPGERRMFALIGVHGQAIYVDPASRLVMVHTAVRERADDPNEETIALWRRLVDVVGARPR